MLPLLQQEAQNLHCFSYLCICTARLVSNKPAPKIKRQTVKERTHSSQLAKIYLKNKSDVSLLSARTPEKVQVTTNSKNKHEKFSDKKRKNIPGLLTKQGATTVPRKDSPGLSPTTLREFRHSDRESLLPDRGSSANSHMQKKWCGH